AKKAEEFLKGKKIDDAAAEKAAELALEDISPISDMRASREYRLHMCRVMVKRALKASVSRLETGEPALNTRLI
ncbi:MAG: xanthine dehydrogenase family protein subunit M, partial [Spirochaetes bacterium]